MFNFDQGENSENFCSPIQLDYDETEVDTMMGLQTEVHRGSGIVAISLEEETTRMDLLLGSLSNSARFSPQAGGTRDDASRGTPSMMDRHRKNVQTNMTAIKKHDG